MDARGWSDLSCCGLHGRWGASTSLLALPNGAVGLAGRAQGLAAGVGRARSALRLDIQRPTRGAPPSFLGRTHRRFGCAVHAENENI